MKAQCRLFRLRVGWCARPWRRPPTDLPPRSCATSTGSRFRRSIRPRLRNPISATTRSGAHEAALKRARLIAELYKAAPDHKRVPALLEERWKTVRERPAKGQYDELLHELDQVITRTKNKKLKIEAAYGVPSSS